MTTTTRPAASQEHSAHRRRRRTPQLDPLGEYLRRIARTPLLSAAEEIYLARRIEAGVYAAELLRRATDGQPLPDRHPRADLELVARDGQRARDHMIRANLRLVVAVAAAYRRPGLAWMDVIQDGNLGLIRAVEKFDYAKGYKFSTYATWWIRQAIQRGSALDTRPIRVPVHLAEQMSTVDRVERELRAELDRDPTNAELSMAAGIPVQRIEQGRQLARSSVSLDAPISEETTECLGDLVVDSDAVPPTAVVEFQALRRHLGRALEALPQPAAMVLTLRYGLRDGRARSRPEVAERMGVSVHRVRQLEDAGLTRLRALDLRTTLLDWAG